MLSSILARSIIWKHAHFHKIPSHGQCGNREGALDLNPLKRFIKDCGERFCTNYYYLFLNLFIFKIIYLFLAALGLCCCVPASSSCSEQGLLFIAVHGLLAAVASLVAEHRLQARGLQQLCHAGSVVVVHRLSCAEACGIFPDQGSNPCPLHWQADS